MRISFFHCALLLTTAALLVSSSLAAEPADSLRKKRVQRCKTRCASPRTIARPSSIASSMCTMSYRTPRSST